MWGRLATCAAVGYRRRSTAKAAGADCQSAAGYQPAPQNLVRQPTPAQFFMGFRGPKAHNNRGEKPMWGRLATGWQPARWLVTAAGPPRRLQGPIANRPQVTNLPHKISSANRRPLS